ncbi:HAD-IA family hydrolase [Rhodovulum sp. DZ06]|uniref:HAD-IA family hydrolase n=1 Tax=Rhodovulum sp. DZ06 TaxID=3425126 RepID=UPI003D33896E
MGELRRGAIFDLDGTLVDSSADLIAAANAALARGGFAGRLDPGPDAGVSGRGGRAMLRLGLARSGLAGAEALEVVEALYPPFLLDYDGMLADRTRLFPGVEACFDTLEASGWALAICTNKPEGLARKLLSALGVLDRFAAVLGADTLPVRKPDPEHLHETIRRAGAAPGASVLVGDTVTDRETARRAGAPSVLMDFGLSADDPHALKPAAVVTDFGALAGVLEGLVPRK